VWCVGVPRTTRLNECDLTCLTDGARRHAQTTQATSYTSHRRCNQANSNPTLLCFVRVFVKCDCAQMPHTQPSTPAVPRKEMCAQVRRCSRQRVCTHCCHHNHHPGRTPSQCGERPARAKVTVRGSLSTGPSAPQVCVCARV
jgi:hypothetical protein